MPRTYQPTGAAHARRPGATSRYTANRRRALALVATPAMVVLVVVGGAVTAGTGPVVGVVAGLLAGAATAAWCWWGAFGLALSGIGAARTGPRELARAHNLVESLCAATGLPKPEIYVVDHPAPDALSVGRGPRRAAVVVTTGLIDQLTPIELEGVLAHELSHIKEGDVIPSTAAVPVLALLGVLTRSSRGRPGRSVRQRETLADMAAVSITRYPPGLITALEKVRDAPSVVQARGAVARALAPAWLRPPDATGAVLEERIEALSEL